MNAPQHQKELDQEIAGKAPAVRVLHVTTITLTLRFLEGHLLYQRAKGFETYVACSPASDLHQSHGAPVH